MPSPRIAFFSDGALFVVEQGQGLILQPWPTLEARTAKVGRGKSRLYWPTFKVLRPVRATASEPEAKPEPKPPLQSVFDFDLPPPPSKLSPTREVADDRRRAFELYRETFPPEVVRLSAPFTFEQWSVLRLMRDEDGAQDLFESNPALAYGVAVQAYAKLHYSGEPPKVCLLKQRSIVEFLGFPSEEWVVKTFRKIPPESMHSGRLTRLRNLVSAGEAKKTLQHLDVISAGVIDLLFDTEALRLCSSRLVQEVAKNPADRYCAHTLQMVQDTFRMGKELDPRMEMAFDSLKQLSRLHDELAVEYREMGGRFSQTGGRFPRPPVRGIPGRIVPITSEEDLVLEGRTQCHCVASYGSQVMERLTYIYRVLWPERATLSIVRGAGRRWEIGQLKAAGNQSCSNKTFEFVEDWLATGKQAK